MNTRDLAQAVLDYAAANNITHIVMGRTMARWRPRQRLTETLTRQATAFTLHLAPLPAAPPPRPPAPVRKGAREPYLLASALLGAVTLIGLMAHDYIRKRRWG